MFNITKEELAAGIKAADEGLEVFHFKNAVSLNPSWEEFAQHLDYEANNKSYNYPPVGNPFTERAVNGVTVKDIFYLVGMISNLDHFKNMETFTEFVKSATKSDIAPVTSFVSLVSGGTSDAHYDCRRTLFWQCQGETRFDHLVSHDIQKQGLPENTKETYILKPGDLIYIGWEVPHNVFVTEPRAAITFTMSPGDGTNYHDSDLNNKQQSFNPRGII